MPRLQPTDAPMRNFDMDVLRSLVALADLGSLSQASARVGRTQAALSLQMRKLEDQAGEALFRKDSRRLVRTEAGDLLLGYARRILALNDEAQQVVRRSSVSGVVRFGSSQDFAESWLPPVLAQFRQAFPSVALEVRVDGGTRSVDAVEAGELDLALALGLGARDHSVSIGQLPLVWIAHRDFRWNGVEPLPLALFTDPCRFRNKGIAALENTGTPWNITLTSPSLNGVWAAVRAGLGITVRTPEGLQPDLEIVDRKFGLPDLGSVDVSLFFAAGARAPAAQRFAELLRDRLAKRITELELRTSPEAFGRRSAKRFSLVR